MIGVKYDHPFVTPIDEYVEWVDGPGDYPLCKAIVAAIILENSERIHVPNGIGFRTRSGCEYKIWEEGGQIKTKPISGREILEILTLMLDGQKPRIEKDRGFFWEVWNNTLPDYKPDVPRPTGNAHLYHDPGRFVDLYA